jgi:PadR family transcriptional regulator, regulatory protein AphA
MSLKHAILGFLNYKPATGYELKAMFDNSVQHFWPADQAQIYRTLSDLTSDGLATMEVVLQEDRPNRKVYSISQAGREELRRWLTTPMPLPEPRHAGLVQVFFAGQLSNAQVLAMFEQSAEQTRQVLAVYELIPQQIEDYVLMVDSARETFFWMLTLEMGVRSMRANLEWIESVIDRLKDGQVPED